MLPIENPCRTHPQVIVAIDVESATKADDIVHSLGPASNHYKVGLQLLTAAGPDVFRKLVTSGKHVFLDLTLHEIPSSAREANLLRAILPVGTLIVCPGIQVPSAQASDQTRSATPQMAAHAGASHVPVQ